MTQQEQNEINQLPEKYRPISAWGYLGYTILFALPLVGWIILIINAISAGNVNLKNFARSYFCVLLLGIIVAVIVIILTATGIIAAGAAAAAAGA